MKRMLQRIGRFHHYESGLVTVEYAVAGGLVTATLVAAFTGLGGQVATMIGSISGFVGG